MSIPEQYKDIILSRTKRAAILGVAGGFIPGTDVPFLLGIWVEGARAIAIQAGDVKSHEQWKGIATSVLSGVALYLAGAKVATWFFNLLPGPGTVLHIAANSSLNALFTYRFLRAVTKIYDGFDGEEVSHSLAANLLAVVGAVVLPEEIQEINTILRQGEGAA